MRSGVGLRLCHSTKLPGNADVEGRWSKMLSKFPIGFIWLRASSGPLEQSTGTCGWETSALTLSSGHMAEQSQPSTVMLQCKGRLMAC